MREEQNKFNGWQQQHERSAPPPQNDRPQPPPPQPAPEKRQPEKRQPENRPPGPPS